MPAILLILVVWSMAGTPAPEEPQQAVETETPSVLPADTLLPSPTIVLPTATLEPTSLETASPTLELPPSATPVTPVHVKGRYVPDEILIQFKQRAKTEGINGCLRAIGATINSQIEQLSVYVIKIPKDSVGMSLAGLSRCPEVRRAEPNYLAQAADIIPSDPGWGQQYGLANIRAPEGWDLSTGSAAVTIAIIDTGVDLGHPDLSAKIVGGYDFVNGDAVAQDDNGHGTHVAGIAAAVTNNNVGMAGVSWGARIMPVKVLDLFGNGSFADVSAGIAWAADHGAQVINLSLGGASGSTVLQDAVDYAYARGAVIVAAAGNSGSNFVLYPARYPHVIAVAATNSANTQAGFSNYGPEVDLAAPGDLIYSTRPGGSYGYMSGTSMSAPFVSGLAAILRGIAGLGSADAIAWDLESTALDLGPAGQDQLYGYGLIQMDAALRKALPPTPTATLSATATTTFAGGTGGVNLPPYQPVSPSLTPTLTLTPSPTFIMTASPTGTLISLTGIATSSAELSAQNSAAAGSPSVQSLTSRLGNDWPLGCGGSLLILLGIWLAWRSSRRGHSRHMHSQYLRMR